MPKSNQVMGKQGMGQKQTQADLTQNYAALAQKVLADPSIFPDTFTAWIPRWIMQNVNFKITASQLPTLETTRLVGATGQPAFTNSWANFGTSDEAAGFFKDAWGIVHLTGTIKSGTLNTAAFTLPAGYRPDRNMIFPAAANAAFGVLQLLPDGSVIPVSGSNVYFTLNGVSFRAFS